MFESLTRAIDALATSSLDNPAIAFPVYFLAGLVSSVFPCVYPLIPITAGFLQNRTRAGESRWKHPLLYWAGATLAYGALGLIAALSGGAFNVFMQNGFVITLTGFLFLFLAAVTLDWYPLAWGAGDRLVQGAARHTGAGFTIVMGFFAGLVASACVAPALVAMLLFVAKHAAASASSFGVVAYGGALALSFGAGIGVPFFLAGVLGARLPKSGPWMSVVKHGFALLVLLAAAWELSKGFQTLGYSEMDVSIILGGIALVIVAAWLGLKPPPVENKRELVRFIFALLALLFAAALIIRGAGLGGLTGPAHQAGAGDAATQFEMTGDLKFYRDRDHAYALAAREGRPVFIDFYADWCANCKDFAKLAENDARLNAALKQAVLLKIYDTDPVFAEYQNDPRYSELMIGLPFFLVMKSDGAFHWKGNNYRDIEGFETAIRSAAGG